MNERKYEHQHKDEEEKASDISNQMANLTTQRAVIMVLLTLLLPALVNPSPVLEADTKFITGSLGVAAQLYGTNFTTGSLNESLIKGFMNSTVQNFLVQYPDVLEIEVELTSTRNSLLQWQRSDMNAIMSKRRVSGSAGGSPC